ncbi:MAG: ABC transporter substrate-binding protein [Candidatus Auribacterota bacterium]
MYKIFCWWVCVFLTLVAVAGCGFRERPYDTVYIRLKDDITTLDPALIVDVDGGMLAAYLYNGLVKLDFSLNVVPDIAHKWEILDNDTRYRFYLKKNIRFTNGDELTARDVKYSFERLLDPSVKSSRSWIFENVAGCNSFMSGNAGGIEGFVVVDDYTLDIVLKEPFAPFISLLTMPNVMISKIVSDSDGNRHVYGTGPFILNDWVRGDSIRFIRNENYFDKMASVAKVAFKIIPEDFTAITEFENGRIDILEVPGSEFEYFVTDARWKDRVYRSPLLNTYYVGFNCQKEPFNSVEMRHAVGYAVNREGIIEKFLHNRVTRADSPVPPDLLGSKISIAEHKYDPGKAIDMISSLPGSTRKEISLYFSSNKETEGIAELIQYDLAQAGLSVSLCQLEWSVFKEKVASGEAEMFILSWWADYPDIENFLYPVFYSGNWGSAGNRVRYKNEEFDEVILIARKTADDMLRTDLYRQALSIIENDAPWVCLWHRDKFVVIQPWICNFKLAGVHSVDKGTDITIDATTKLHED